jgi:hypothetical protein
MLAKDFAGFSFGPMRARAFTRPRPASLQVSQAVQYPDPAFGYFSRRLRQNNDQPFGRRLLGASLPNRQQPLA